MRADGRNSAPERSTATARTSSPKTGITRTRDACALDPAEATETKRLVITPSVARDDQAGVQSANSQQTQAQTQPGPLLPSAILQKRQQELEQERKRAREEIEAAEEATKKRAAKSRDGLGLGPPPSQNQASLQKGLTRSPSQ